MSNNLFSFIEQAASQALQGQRTDGSCQPGWNGPYRDPETPVRNTAHWIVSWARLFQLSGQKKFKKAAESGVDYLLGTDARPMGASFYCRTNPEKDFCNGVMGQAWVMEALLAARDILGREDAGMAALALYSLHPFLESEFIWRRVAVDGSYLSPDSTFNHQLWFAAVAAGIGDQQATEQAKAFLTNVGAKVRSYADGILFHQAAMQTRVRPGNLVGLTRLELKKVLNRGQIYEKSLGYHAFNLYAFALLKQSFPNHEFWFSAKFRKFLEVTKTERFCSGLNKNKYAYPYNPPGFELAYVGEVFDFGQGYSSEWLNRQLEKTYQPGSVQLVDGIPDPLTLSARVYEATRLKTDYAIN